MLCLVFVALSSAVCCVWASCTNMAVQKAMSCASQLNIGFPTGTSPIGPTSGGNTDRLTGACGRGDLLAAIQCIETMMEKCQGQLSDDALFLGQMVDTDKARRSVGLLCAHIDVYTANIDCIGGHHDQQVTCAREARTTYQAEASRADSTVVLLKLHCTFYETVLECLQTVLRDKCSDQVADMVTAVVEGFGPPSCASSSKRRVKQVGQEGTHTTGITNGGTEDGAQTSGAAIAPACTLCVCRSCCLVLIVVLCT